MMALSITRTIVIIVLWSTIQEVHAKGPQLNTLYVEIGQLYPRADFAGVLINLNVDKAIERGKSALNLTDHFLHYNKTRQIMGKYSGATKTYISLPSNVLQTSIKSQMPRHKASPRNTNRHRREINFDIDFDVN